MGELLTKKNIISLLILAIIILAIPLTVRLAQQQQILQSKAAAGQVKFVESDTLKCDAGQTKCTTKTPFFELELTSPLGPP